MEPCSLLSARYSNTTGPSSHFLGVGNIHRKSDQRRRHLTAAVLPSAPLALDVSVVGSGAYCPRPEAANGASPAAPSSAGCRFSSRFGPLQVQEKYADQRGRADDAAAPTSRWPTARPRRGAATPARSTLRPCARLYGPAGCAPWRSTPSSPTTRRSRCTPAPLSAAYLLGSGATGGVYAGGSRRTRPLLGFPPPQPSRMASGGAAAVRGAARAQGGAGSGAQQCSCGGVCSGRSRAWARSRACWARTRRPVAGEGCGRFTAGADGCASLQRQRAAAR